MKDPDDMSPSPPIVSCQQSPDILPAFKAYQSGVNARISSGVTCTSSTRNPEREVHALDTPREHAGKQVRYTSIYEASVQGTYISS